MSAQLLQVLKAPSGEDAQDRYTVHQFSVEADFLHFVKQKANWIDCLILEEYSGLQALLEQLQKQSVFFPAIILQIPFASADTAPATKIGRSKTDRSHLPAKSLYHAATLHITVSQLSQIDFLIDQAINQFIQLSPIDQASQVAKGASELPAAPRSLMAQQIRLAEKLKERLGYLGVYYKRNPQNFLRHMTQSTREELLKQLKAEYREIILSYFSDEPGLNEKIDNFVNVAFFADVPVSQVVEIHMKLMDEFSKQLKLEGRSDEILLDYRLTLIDTIAHLCEMYRRSIPRES
jgi:circadian clock protein KaiA